MEIDSMSSEEIESAAAEQGWRSDGEKDAETFLRDGETILPIVNAKYKKLSEQFEGVNEELSSVKEQLEKSQQAMQEFSEYHKGTAQRQYEKAKKDIQNELEQIEIDKVHAVQEGDTDEYNKLNRQSAIKQDEIKELEVPVVNSPAPGPSPAFADWKKDNPWFDSDVFMKAQANLIFPHVYSPGMSEIDHYNKVTEEIKKQYPDKFERKNGGNDVEDDTGAGTQTKGTGKYTDLPPEAKAACDKFIADIPGFTRKQYLEEYDWS